MSETSQIHNYTEKETVINYLVVSSLSRFYTELSFQNRIIASLAGSPVLFLYPRNLRNAKDPFFHERLTSSTSGHFCLIFFFVLPSPPTSASSHHSKISSGLSIYKTERRTIHTIRSLLKWLPLKKGRALRPFCRRISSFSFPFSFFYISVGRKKFSKETNVSKSMPPISKLFRKDLKNIENPSNRIKFNREIAYDIPSFRLFQRKSNFFAIRRREGKNDLGESPTNLKFFQCNPSLLRCLIILSG